MNYVSEKSNYVDIPGCPCNTCEEQWEYSLLISRDRQDWQKTEHSCRGDRYFFFFLYLSVTQTDFLLGIPKSLAVSRSLA